MPLHLHHRLVLGCLALAGAVAAGLALGAPSPTGLDAAAAAGAPGPPNIVLIQADDQTLAQLNDEVMPNTERILADHGTEFTNYIATTAQCCPSRSTLLTGQYAHNHGVTSNDVGYPGLIGKRNVLPVWLRHAGYRTMHVGSKYVNGFPHSVHPSTRVAPGWDDWFTSLSPTHAYDYELSVNGHHRFRGHKPSDYMGRVLAKEATSLIHAHARGSQPFHARGSQPFYLQLDELAPHVSEQDDPFGGCSHAPIPDPRDEGKFSAASLPASPSFNEQDIGDKPAFLRSAPLLSEKSKQQLTAKWRCSLASLSSVDRTVRKVFNAVKQSGELSNTVFIYISDNGLFYGEHRIHNGKVFPYEEALHLPLLMRVPKRYRDGVRRLKTVGRPVGNIDLAPTILALAGAQPCPAQGKCRTMDGRSLMSLLTRSGHWPHGRGLLTEYREPDLPRYSTCQFAGIRTRNQIYVQHFRVANPSTGQCMDEKPPEVELYDLKADPFELDNLCYGGSTASCPKGKAQTHLERRLYRLQRCAGVKGRDEKVDGRPFCE